MRIGGLEQLLKEILTPDAAESWDRTGMLVGNAHEEISRVAVSLDPTFEAIDFAKEHGCNVLVTHHPLFLDPPQEIKPFGSNDDAVGGRIWHAIASGVSIISFHTALDANPASASVLSQPLGITLTGETLEEVPGFPGYGYGRIGEVTCTLGELGTRCTDALGGTPRIWGDPNREVTRACCWTGAAGDAPRECIARGIDVLICGEVKYHAALDASEMGLSIVELGHDVSEQVHCSVLIESLKTCGIPSDEIYLMPLPKHWWVAHSISPETA